jgi:hypothetical protein
MYSWQIKALKLEESALDSLAGFIHEHALGFFIGSIWLLMALLAWVVVGGQRRKGGNSAPHVQTGIVIHFSVGRLAPPPEPFESFPPVREPLDHDSDN